MREIRFRAWHKEEKFMATVTKIDWDEKLVETEWKTFAKDVKEAAKKGKHWLDTSLDNGKPFRNIRHFNEVELLEFTGLKDVDGKEIYEGDIGDLVTYQAIVGKITHRAIVKWNGDRFSFFSFEANGKEMWHVDIRSFYLNFTKLGNIYENPELLEAEE